MEGQTWRDISYCTVCNQFFHILRLFITVFTIRTRYFWRRARVRKDDGPYLRTRHLRPFEIPLQSEITNSMKYRTLVIRGWGQDAILQLDKRCVMEFFHLRHP